jgi:hypothetical protein
MNDPGTGRFQKRAVLGITNDIRSPTGKVTIDQQRADEIARRSHDAQHGKAGDTCVVACRFRGGLVLRLFEMRPTREPRPDGGLKYLA